MRLLTFFSQIPLIFLLLFPAIILRILIGDTWPFLLLLLDPAKEFGQFLLDIAVLFRWTSRRTAESS